MLYLTLLNNLCHTEVNRHKLAQFSHLLLLAQNIEFNLFPFSVSETRYVDILT
jgi:hypothetical protein